MNIIVACLLREVMTHSMVFICPAFHCNFIKGFDTKGTDLDVPVDKKNPKKFRVSLQDTAMFSLP